MSKRSLIGNNYKIEICRSKILPANSNGKVYRMMQEFCFLLSLKGYIFQPRKVSIVKEIERQSKVCVHCAHKV